MKIEKLMKILSSKTRLKLLAHFYTCICKKHNVSSLVEKIKTTQANISKNLIHMEENLILVHTSEHKVKYYSINPEFRKEWNYVLEPVLVREELSKYFCECANEPCT